MSLCLVATNLAKAEVAWSPYTHGTRYDPEPCNLEWVENKPKATQRL